MEVVATIQKVIYLILVVIHVAKKEPTKKAPEENTTYQKRVLKERSNELTRFKIALVKIGQKSHTKFILKKKQN